MRLLVMRCCSFIFRLYQLLGEVRHRALRHVTTLRRQKKHGVHLYDTVACMCRNPFPGTGGPRSCFLYAARWQWHTCNKAHDTVEVRHCCFFHQARRLCSILLVSAKIQHLGGNKNGYMLYIIPDYQYHSLNLYNRKI